MPDPSMYQSSFSDTYNNIAINTTPVELCKFNPRRIGLWFGGQAVTLVRVGILQSDVNMLVLGGAGASMALTWKDWPMLVTRQWFGVASGPTNLTVYEQLYIPEER